MTSAVKTKKKEQLRVSAGEKQREPDRIVARREKNHKNKLPPLSRYPSNQNIWPDPVHQHHDEWISLFIGRSQTLSIHLSSLSTHYVSTLRRNTADKKNSHQTAATLYTCSRMCVFTPEQVLEPGTTGMISAAFSLQCMLIFGRKWQKRASFNEEEHGRREEVTDVLAAQH